MITKRQILSEMSFGRRIAEEESRDLANQAQID